MLPLVSEMYFQFSSLQIFIFVIQLLILSEVHAKEYEQYSKCLEDKFECGQEVVNISYPFWGNNRQSYCGLEGFELTCDNNEDYPTIDINSLTFRVLSINQSNQEIWIKRTGAEDDKNLCPPVVNTTVLNRTRFGSNPKTEVLYVYYDCPDSLDIELPGSSIWDDFKCTENGVQSKGFYVADSFSEDQLQVFEQCRIQLVAPVLQKALEEFRNNDTMTLVEVLKQGFVLDYIIDEVACSACVNSSGLCGSDAADSRRFQCLCRDGAYPVSCPTHGKSNTLFWGGDQPWYCGIPELKLSCKNDEFAVLGTGSDKVFRVVNINQSSHEISMKRKDLEAGICPPDNFSTELSETLFDSCEKTEVLRVFYNCSSELELSGQNSSFRSHLTCLIGEFGPKTVGFFGNGTFSSLNHQNLESCKYKFSILVNKTVFEEFKKNVTMEVQELLNLSFVVKYRLNDVACTACLNSGGLCWYGLNFTNTCLYQDRVSISVQNF